MKSSPIILKSSFSVKEKTISDAWEEKTYLLPIFYFLSDEECYLEID